ncbi:MAG: DUF1320 domain-containing protein [bacterium]|nr:DUF1320 domain-containing protein [bacterium]
MATYDSYIEADDCLTLISEASLIRIFSEPNEDGSDPTEVDADLFGQAAEAASREVDGYLRRRYGTIPVAAISADLKLRVVIITLYRGYSRGGGTVPEGRRNDYKDAVHWLEQMAKGEVDPGIAVPPAANENRSPTYSANGRKMTRDELSGIMG